MKFFAFDTETFPIRAERVCPELVCVSFAWRAEDGTVQAGLLGNTEEEAEQTREMFERLLRDPSWHFAAHNAAFDWGVILSRYPDLLPLVFDAAEAHRLHCTQIREKLLNLSTHGSVTRLKLPDGGTKDILYNLGSLQVRYGLETRKEDKESEMRVSYYLVSGRPAAEYPADWQRYAIADATDVLHIVYAQEDLRNEETKYGSLKSSGQWGKVALGYQFDSMAGIAIDRDYADWMVEHVESATSEEHFGQMIEAGLLVPARPSQPYANGAKHPDGTPKMTAPKKATEKKVPAQVRVLAVAREHELPVYLTDKGFEKFDKGKANPTLSPGELSALPDDEVLNYVSLAKDAMKSYGPYDPVLQEKADYALFGKIKTTWAPTVKEANWVTAKYDPVKETGRFGAKVDKLFPSLPLHQPPKKIGDVQPRLLLRPRAGYVWIVGDVTALEIGSVAQRTWDTVGKRGVRCVHREMMNAKRDIHAYFGAQIAQMIDPNFARMTAGAPPEETFLAFQEAGQDPELRKVFWKTYRTMAKPIDLGLPGGQGRARIREGLAQATGKPVTIEETSVLVDLYYERFEEIPAYFEMMRSEMVDPFNTRRRKDGEESWKGDELYWYEMPDGTVRRGCIYTEGANGSLMQSIGACGYNELHYRLVRECLDETRGSVLYGCRVVLPLHDEWIIEAPFDGTTAGLQRLREQAARAKHVSEDGLRYSMPDVTMIVEPALTTRWVKDAEPTYEHGGIEGTPHELVIYDPLSGGPLDVR